MVTDYKLTRFPVTHHTCTFEHYFGCHGVETVIEVAKRAKQPMCSKGRSLSGQTTPTHMKMKAMFMLMLMVKTACQPG